ncbi:MAG TPA: glutamine amidotransferase, partial [Verrucomicrobiae bacterium]|nr:glutamine amidotransferase [Verrucomicrobiae bacterium]
GRKIYPVEHPTLGFPRTLEALSEYDVVIHSDIKKDSFTAKQLESIARLVEEKGGGFVMIGGNSAFGKGGYHRTILDRIIPVAMEQENDSQNTPFRIQMARPAWTHPIVNFGANFAETKMIWTEKFPALYGFNKVDRAKPGATVLAENPAYRSRYGAGVLLAVQEVGNGRSMAFTSDTTRTWGRDFEALWGEPVRPGAVTEENCDRRYYRQFWVNAIRWLASGKVGRTNNPVTLELAQSQCRPDETVAASVKVRDTELSEVGDAKVSIFLVNTGKTNLPVQARFDAASRTYVADLHPGIGGTFTVTAVAERSGIRLGDDRQLLVAENADLEMADVRARPEFMAALASSSKGENYTGKSGVASPAYAFAKAPPPKIEYRRASVWDKGIWLALILGLLATEWAVRRKKGLA